MVKVQWLTKTDLNTLESGLTTRWKVKALFTTAMGTRTAAHSKTIRLMALASSSIGMDRATKGTGKMTFSTVRARRFRLMDLLIKANIIWVRKMAKVLILGRKKERCILETL